MDEGPDVRAEEGRLAKVELQVRELEEKEARFRALFEQSMDGIFLHDLKGRFLDANPRAAELFGIPRDELRNMPVHRLCTEASRTQLDERLAEVVRDGSTTFELDLIRRDGEVFRAEVRTALVELGDRLLVQGTFRDISLRRQLMSLDQTRSELILALSDKAWPTEAAEVMLRAMFRFEGFDCGALYLFDPGGRLSIAGHLGLPAWFIERVQSYPPDDPRVDLVLHGGTVFARAEDLPELISDDVSKAGHRSLSVVPIRLGTQVLGCLNLGSRKLERIPAHERRFVEQMAGKQIGPLIAERMAREELRQSEERLRLVAQTTTDLMYEWRIKENSLVWFGSVAEQLGYPPGSIPETVEAWVDLIHPDDRSRMAEAVERHRNKSEPFVSSYRVRRADGSWAWWEDRGVPVLDASGAPRRLIGACKDVTEQRHMEEALRQAEKMQAIGLLAGGVAHDFNNQLSGILGYTELLRESIPPGDALREYVAKILTGIERAADLTGQLLAFSRKGKYLAAEVDLGQVISEVVALLERSIDKRILIEQQLCDTPIVTVGDPGQIQNLVLNLALNARDAMPEGGTITFATEQVIITEGGSAGAALDLDPGTYALLSVTDTGLGMDAETRRHIFEPFFTTKPPGKGTGMGLAAAYGTVQSHKGGIEVDSEPGRGSTFRVFLPAGSSAGGARHDNRDATPPRSLEARVLLVDDEDLVRGTTAAILERLGCEVTACENGAAAIEALRADPAGCDLVILDLIMPDMSGRETFEALRAIRPDIKVLLSSGYSLDAEAQRLLEAGAISFMHKPFRLQDLADAVAEALNG